MLVIDNKSLGTIGSTFEGFGSLNFDTSTINVWAQNNNSRDAYLFYLPVAATIAISANSRTSGNAGGYLRLGKDSNKDYNIDNTISQGGFGFAYNNNGIYYTDAKSTLSDIKLQPGYYTLAVDIGYYVSDGLPKSLDYNFDIKTSICTFNVQATSNSIGGEGSAISFIVTRNGSTAFDNACSWSLESSSSGSSATADDFVNTFGSLTFLPGETTKTISVSTTNDKVYENDESFVLRIKEDAAAGNGASVGFATAQGMIKNNDWIGTSSSDKLVGSTYNDYINGGAGTDTLTGLSGNDIFAFQFGHSNYNAPDAITDFQIKTDKIDLLTNAGADTSAPIKFARAVDSTANNLSDVVLQAFADANGNAPGNQKLGVNEAVLIRGTNASIAGTYLVVNNSTPGFQPGLDIVINLTGYSGSLPGLGVINVSDFFV
jgi:hypothetical protein